ncbi:endonuclease/exonuclease/phosphatase family protein [Methylobrevis pamukkalensis]|uniref:Endonuclease/Exonuclease/phosphatase family protein n=1 Tax=Methylobrevis pamukkalensis TaxID=1439726 RepID=A0A1E3H1M2_9HYPH|nr:endonuclease/exonuclease/phosphatase family protein [Methylobrevis pamukkalensis]ODN69696.1 Endonuclease/Exonuclease/phosphatase family protein [Methylobrevis pamukkalensis]
MREHLVETPLPEGPAGPALRVMTWNIHGAVGPDRRFDMDRIAAVIRRHAPDLLAVQEIEGRGRNADVLAWLAGSHGHRADAHTITAPDGAYGHALFSRWALSDVVIHDVRVAGREPRSVIEATAATPAGPVHVLAAHLGLSPAERRRQIRRIAGLVRARSDMTSVVLGDFNDWTPVGHVRRTLAALLPERTRLATFPSWMPRLRLDRIHCRAPARILAAWTDFDARFGSDHLPVIADLRL